MFDDLTFLLNNGIYVWLKMAVDALLTDYHWLGVGIILLPILRRLVNIFRSLY